MPEYTINFRSLLRSQAVSLTGLIAVCSLDRRSVGPRREPENDPREPRKTFLAIQDGPPRSRVRGIFGHDINPGGGVSPSIVRNYLKLDSEP